MQERLYCLRRDQEVFETGMAQGKQLLLATTVHDLLLHWFAPTGEFLGLERRPLSFAQVQREVAALKEEIGFVAGNIAVRKFESEEASIEDLPGEYQEFLDNREAYSEEDRLAFEKYIREWRQANCFVLGFCEQYWMSASGEVEHS